MDPKPTMLWTTVANIVELRQQKRSTPKMAERRLDMIQDWATDEFSDEVERLVYGG